MTVNGDLTTMSEESNVSHNNKPYYFRTRIVWFNALGFLALHLAMLYGVYLMLTGQVMTLTIIWAYFLAAFTSLSVTIGAHRLWAHKSFKAKWPLKLVLMLGQAAAGQNCLWVWVRDHRQHHKYSDTDADPHNSRRGFFFCHIGWLMMKKLPEVIEKGKTIDMSDLNTDPLVMWQKKYYKPLYFLLAFLLPIVVPVYAWNESWIVSLFVSYFARYMLQINGTWCVNSVAHFYGIRPYTKNIPPVDSVYVSAIGFGEGWHNYHHTFPWDYRAAELGIPFNISSSIIDLCAWFGQAYDLRSTTPEMVAYRVAKKGDGSHPLSKYQMESKENMEIDNTDIFGEKVQGQIRIANRMRSPA